ncbi:MAG: 5-formyltetrahydrofolate cyclo-ligase [Firmicutes bacterium]|nr:5-formyltetrahydrofolate cyclo-ligase [Bacillota bacterium]
MKELLRKESLAKRRMLDKEFIAIQSDKMAKLLYASPFYQNSKVVMLFLSMPDEPQMINIIEHAWQQGKTVCVPHMRQQFGVMDAARIDSMDGLVRGRLNLMVPNPANLSLVDPELIDLIVVPAVTYDYHGNRLGMGAGYYDRFIPHACNAILIGVIGASQIVDRVPTGQYDQSVHYLLTEDAIIHCTGKN